MAVQQSIQVTGQTSNMVPAIDFLLSAQNSDGGWAYKRGGMSFVEPTACALLALGRSGSASTPREHGYGFLMSAQHDDGGWGIAPVDHESGWMTAWSVLALTRYTNVSEPLGRGLEWLVRTRGLTFDDPTARQQISSTLNIDASLIGWPWHMGDASWVFPTGLAMLALTAAGQTSHPRVEQGRAFLADRSIPSGGWNSGNNYMVGKTLLPTIEATAGALLALLAASTELGAQTSAALEYLKTAAGKTRAPSELAWCAIALKRHGQEEATSTIARLGSLQQPDGSWQGNPFVTALAHLAITERPDEFP